MKRQFKALAKRILKNRIFVADETVALEIFNSSMKSGSLADCRKIVKEAKKEIKLQKNKKKQKRS